MTAYREWTEQVLAHWPEKQASIKYRECLYRLAEGSRRVLELGCGYDKNEITRPLETRTEVIGVDLDPRAGLRYHGIFWLADAAMLPFADSQFDLICAAYMLEHACDPSAIFREAQRVLVPGGSMALLTSNRWSYKALAAALTTFSFHRRMGRYRYRRSADEDMFPTLFRANTVPRLVKMLEGSGFREIEALVFSNGPSWFRGMPLLFELGCVYHRLIERVRQLSFLRCAIVATAVKGGPKARVPDRLDVRCLSCDRDGVAADGEGWKCLSCDRGYAVEGNVVHVARDLPTGSRSILSEPRKSPVASGQ